MEVAAGSPGAAPQPNSKGSASLKPGELLPSVLRTSADLPGQLVKAGGGGHAGPPGSRRETEGLARGSPGAAAPPPPVRLADLSSMLPRLDAGSSAHLQALPARPALTIGCPQRQREQSRSPERRRAAAVSPPRASAAVKQQQQAAHSSGAWRPGAGEVPAVGSIGMSAVSPTVCWQSAQHQHADNALPAAAASSSSTADDLRLLRPVNPTQASHYWQPAGPGVSRGGKAAAGAGDATLGAQLMLAAGGAAGMPAPTSHTRQRKSILLRLPLGTEGFLSAVPAALQDCTGRACLLVLPSDKPSTRKEAVAVEDLLAALLEDPGSAASKACQWRAALLSGLCADSLAVVAAALQQRGTASTWQFRQLARNLTDKMLGHGMVAAVGALVSGSERSSTATQMALLLDSKAAAAQVAAEAAEAASATAAAAAPVANKGLIGLHPDAAASAAAELAALSALSSGQQQELWQPSIRNSSRLGSPSVADSHQPRAQSLAGQPQAAAASCSSDGSSGEQRQQMQSSGRGRAAVAGSQARTCHSSGGTAYELLTVVTGAESPTGSSSSPEAAAAGSPTAGLCIGAAAGGGRSPSNLNPHVRPAPEAGAASPRHQQQLGAPSTPDVATSSSGAPHQHSRQARSSSRCGSPAPVSAPGTPQGCFGSCSGLGGTAAALRSRDVSPGAGGRSSSATGSSAAQLTEQQGGAAQQQQPQEEAVVQSWSRHAEQLSGLYGLSLSAAICMADLVRQVEVGCVERGHALAYAFNASVSTGEALLGELRGQNAALLAANGQLAAQQAELVKELKSVDFLRREALRFRRAMEEAQEGLGAASADNARLQQQLEAAASELQAVEDYASQRLAQLRWRNAFAVLGTWGQQSVVQSGGIRRGPGHVLPKVRMLDSLVTAVHSVEHRKRAYGRAQQTSRYEGQPGHAVQTASAGPQFAAPGRRYDASYSNSSGLDTTPQMLAVLTAEARTMVLAAMPPSQRWQLLAAMRDEERADVVVAMGQGLRKEAAAALDPRLWERTMDVVKGSSTHAARYLKGMDVEDAAPEFLAWGLYQQVDCLASLDAYTAAALLTRAPDELRRELLGLLEPYVAANIVQAMLPPPAAAAMTGLDLKKAMAILVAMDANKAADVLTEMGAPQAADTLLLMEADARNSILESMAPRTAADTLTSMEDVVAAAAAAAAAEGLGGWGADGGEGDGPEMLTLSGGGRTRHVELDASPVMGAMMQLDPANAHSIMSYMSIKDKAALLATMEPEAVARLLACMDPHEAVLLLAALGDGSARLVGAHLSAEERDGLVDALQAADCRPARGRAPSGRRKGGAKYVGSFRRGAAQETVERLVDTYEAIEAVAMGAADEEEEDDTDPAPEPQASQLQPPQQQGRSTPASSSNAKAGSSRRNTKPQRAVKPPMVVPDSGNTAGEAPALLVAEAAPAPVAAGVSSAPDADAGDSAAAAAGRGAAAVPAAAAGAAGSGGSARGPEPAAASDKTPRRSAEYAADAAADGADSGSDAAAAGAVPAAGKGSKASKAGQARAGGKPAAAAEGAATGEGSSAAGKKSAGATARERRLSTSSQVEAAGPADSEPPPSRKPAAAAGSKPGASSGSSAPAAAAAATKPRRARGSDASDGTATTVAGHTARRGSGSVPQLPLHQQGSDSGGGSNEDDSSTPGTSHRAPPAPEGEASALSEDAAAPPADSTPRTHAGSKGGGRTALAARSAAAGRKALRDALKHQAAAKKPVAAAAAGAGGGGDDEPSASEGPGLGRSSAGLGGATSGGPASDPQQQQQAAAGGDAQPPQVKLGRVPRNARLIEAMAQHKNAKPKPRGWLMGVVENILREGETLLRKLGRADMIKKQSVPEIVFAYFHNKYGQRELVNTLVGSLVNSLTLYQHTDLRLEAFARQLSEEWDVSVFIDFLVAQQQCLQPARVACIEYPREAGKDEQYPWVCMWKAVWVADSMLGLRSQAARERFNEFLQLASVPADEADVERLRRERREAAAKDAVAGGGGGNKPSGAGAAGEAELPERFFKLPRIRFLLLLSKEILRINRFITTFGEDRFASLDVQRCGRLAIVAVRGFVKAVSPGASNTQVSEHIHAFVSTAEAAVREMAPEAVAVGSVAELGRDAFVAGVSGTPAVRDHIKLHLLPPARLEEEDADAQVFYSLLGVLLLRHSKALLPTWEQALQAAGQRAGGALQQQLAAVEASNTPSDARLKAYVGLLLGLINVSAQSYVEGLLGSQGAELDSGLASQALEQGLMQLEDAALITVRGCGYLLALSQDGGPQAALALARMARLPLGAQIGALGGELLLHRRMQDGMTGNAAAVLQRVWRARQRQRQRQRAQAHEQ